MSSPRAAPLTPSMSKKIRLIDFGSACFEDSTLFTYIQSRHYRAPEVILGLPYSCAIDMWSLGCIAVELFYGIPLFPGENEYNQLLKIIKVLGYPPDEMLARAANTSKFFVWERLNSDAFGFRLKTRDEYERDENTVLEQNREYFNYSSLRDFCLHVQFRVSSKDEPRKLELRNSFYDFLTRTLVWDPEKRLRPDQALLHPFITQDIFTTAYTPVPPTLPLKEHPPTAIRTTEQALETMASATFMDKFHLRTRSFSPPSYYEFFIDAYKRGIIFNTKNSNPFTLPPMTPPSYTILFCPSSPRNRSPVISRSPVVVPRSPINNYDPIISSLSPQNLATYSPRLTRSMRNSEKRRSNCITTTQIRINSRNGASALTDSTGLSRSLEPSAAFVSGSPINAAPQPISAFVDPETSRQEIAHSWSRVAQMMVPGTCAGEAGDTPSTTDPGDTPSSTDLSHAPPTPERRDEEPSRDI